MKPDDDVRRRRQGVPPLAGAPLGDGVGAAARSPRRPSPRRRESAPRATRSARPAPRLLHELVLVHLDRRERRALRVAARWRAAAASRSAARSPSAGVGTGADRRRLLRDRRLITRVCSPRRRHVLSSRSGADQRYACPAGRSAARTPCRSTCPSCSSRRERTWRRRARRRAFAGDASRRETAAIRTRTDAQHSVTAQLISTQQQLATARDLSAPNALVDPGERGRVREGVAGAGRAERVAQDAVPARPAEAAGSPLRQRLPSRLRHRAAHPRAVVRPRRRRRRRRRRASIWPAPGAPPPARPARAAYRTETARSTRVSTSASRGHADHAAGDGTSTTPDGATATATS